MSRGFRTVLTHTGLFSNRRWQTALNFGRKQRFSSFFQCYENIHVGIGLNCTFGFAYAKKHVCMIHSNSENQISLISLRRSAADRAAYLRLSFLTNSKCYVDQSAHLRIVKSAIFVRIVERNV